MDVSSSISGHQVAHTKAPLRAWGRLLRLSMAPSAMADAAAGICLGFGDPPRVMAIPAPAWWLLISSACVYCSGMVFNDWVDRDQDAEQTRERPIPQGLITSQRALQVGLLLLGLGLVLAAGVHPVTGVWMTSLAALALAYNLAWRGPLRGPFCLAVCRAANMATPVVLAAWIGQGPRTGAFTVCGIYGLFVFFAARLARWEDGEDSRAPREAPRHAMRKAALALVALPVAGLALSVGGASFGLAALLVALLASRNIWRMAEQLGSAPSRNRIGQAAGATLGRMPIASAVAALCCARGFSGPVLWVAAAILCCYPLGSWLRRVFPAT